MSVADVLPIKQPAPLTDEPSTVEQFAEYLENCLYRTARALISTAKTHSSRECHPKSQPAFAPRDPPRISHWFLYEDSYAIWVWYAFEGMCEVGRREPLQMLATSRHGPLLDNPSRYPHEPRYTVQDVTSILMLVMRSTCPRTASMRSGPFVFFC